MLDHFHYFYFIANSTEYSDEMKSRFESIITYIEKNYSGKITLGGLCETEHYNYKYLSHFFKMTLIIFSGTGASKPEAGARSALCSANCQGEVDHSQGRN